MKVRRDLPDAVGRILATGMRGVKAAVLWRARGRRIALPRSAPDLLPRYRTLNVHPAARR